MFVFNPIKLEHKSVQGAISTATKLNITVKYSGDLVELHIKKDGGNYKAYPMTKAPSKDSFFVCLEPMDKGLYFYHFVADGTVFGAANDLYANEQGFNSYRDYQLTVYDKYYNTSDLLKGGILYQIFPDRFCRAGLMGVEPNKVLRSDWGGKPTYRNQSGQVLNNEFFGGDFKGILSKLEYLKELGVTVIYLNPISKAYSSHRYDTGDYLTPDPLLGTEDELKMLLSQAKKLGISFIFDGVYNHTGADSKYFNRYSTYPPNGAFNTPESPYFNWYNFDYYPYRYTSWWNFETLPSINKDCRDYQDFICNKVLPHYFEMGFKGVRLDVADELSSKFIESIRKVAKSYGAVVIGEVWEDATNKYAYGERRKYFLGNQLDSVMNYPLKDAICDYLLHADTGYLVQTLTTQINNFPKAALDSLMNSLSTHDTVRIINALGRKQIVTDKDLLKDLVFTNEEYQKGRDLAMIAYAILYTVYGSPCVYYGDEAGLTGDLDPYNRCCYPWGKEDKIMLDFIKKLGRIRKSPVFYEGQFNILYFDKRIIIYERTDGFDRIIVAASMDTSPVNLKFSEPLHDILNGGFSQYVHQLKPQSVSIFKPKK